MNRVGGKFFTYYKKTVGSLDKVSESHMRAHCQLFEMTHKNTPSTGFRLFKYILTYFFLDQKNFFFR